MRYHNLIRLVFNFQKFVSNATNEVYSYDTTHRINSFISSIHKTIEMETKLLAQVKMIGLFSHENLTYEKCILFISFNYYYVILPKRDGQGNEFHHENQ